MENNMENKNGINFKKYAMTSLTVEKLEDTKFEGSHPNGYNTGYIIKNAIIDIGRSNKFCVLFVNYGYSEWFHTSEVQKQEEHEGYDLLYTLNSVYKVTPNFTAITGVQEKHSLTVK